MLAIIILIEIIKGKTRVFNGTLSARSPTKVFMRKRRKVVGSINKRNASRKWIPHSFLFLLSVIALASLPYPSRDG